MATELNLDAYEAELAQLQLAEDIGTGTANVTAEDRKKLAPLMRHYLSKPKPFTSCVRDQIKHGLSEDHAKKRCAVLLDASGVPWRHRGRNHAQEQSPEGLELSAPLDMDAYEAALETERMSLAVFKWDSDEHPRDLRGRFKSILGNLDMGAAVRLPDPNPGTPDWKIRKIAGERFQVEPPHGRNYTHDTVDEVAADPMLALPEEPFAKGDAVRWHDAEDNPDNVGIITDDLPDGYHNLVAPGPEGVGVEHHYRVHDADLVRAGVKPLPGVVDAAKKDTPPDPDTQLSWEEGVRQEIRNRGGDPDKVEAFTGGFGMDFAEWGNDSPKEFVDSVLDEMDEQRVDWKDSALGHELPGEIESPGEIEQAILRAFPDAEDVEESQTEGESDGKGGIAIPDWHWTWNNEEWWASYDPATGEDEDPYWEVGREVGDKTWVAFGDTIIEATTRASQGEFDLEGDTGD